MATAQEQQGPIPPCWIQDPMIRAPQGPESWVIYIVAKIADNYRPLAVATLLQGDIDPIQFREINAVCRHIVPIFSDPANKLAIASEMNLAAEFYHDPQNLRLPVQELPLMDHQEILRNMGGPSVDYSRIPEFPFISTSLLLGDNSLVPMPLGTVFRDENAYFGMVVFDISNLEDLKYGIVAFQSQIMIFLETMAAWRQWTDWGRGPDGRRELKVESERPRHAISAKTYLMKFGTEYGGPTADNTAFEPLSVVEPAAFQLIWPSGQKSPEDTVHQNRVPSVQPLLDITVTTLVESISATDVLDSSLFDEPRRLPAFKKALRRVLQERSATLRQSRSTAYLIALAFDGETHLDLARFRGLSAKTISDALETKELKHIKTLSICVDFLSSMPVDIASMLSSHLSLAEIYLLQSATRKDDEASIQTLLELFKYIDPAPHIPKIFVSGVFSAALRRQAWLPKECTAPASIAPIQCIFRRKLSNPRLLPKKHWFWKSYYIGDGLLNPHQFAAGFLNWLRSPGSKLHSFTTGPPTLKDSDTAGVELTPIPADTLRATAHLLPGSSHVLVSHETHWDREANERNRRTGGWEPTEFTYVRFAFIQISNDFRVQSATPDTPLRLKKEDVSVRGLKEFLDTTASTKGELDIGTDSGSIERRLRELGESIECGDRQARKPADLETVAVMSEDEVCEALNEMLQALK
ncbi:hypothetical protein F4678DRAFT_468736 [Xylaria arbuscula]|nr:hypothetical protein F4678DRAFT_468736 [Xylaria arbuscula]